MELIRASRTAVLAIAVMFGANSSPADAESYEPADDLVYPLVIVSGIEVADQAYETYTGLFYAFNGDLDREGFVLRVLGSFGDFEYHVEGKKIDADYWQGDVMLGYQWVRGGIDIGAYIGVDYQDYDLTLDDITSDLRGDEFGFKVALDLESNGNDNSPIYLAIYGDYSTAFDSYHALARIGYNFGRFTLGPEVWLLGDDSGDAQRLGGFLKFDLPELGTVSGELLLSAGYQFVDDSDNDMSGNFGEEGAYATINFKTAFGRQYPAPLK